MKHFQNCFDALDARDLAPWAAALAPVVESIFYTKPHGDLAKWLQVIEQLPSISSSHLNLLAYPLEIGQQEQLTQAQWQSMQELLMQLHPWRKGPISLFGQLIDTEWRSDWKWQRIRPHLDSLQGKRILDVGCGNGYYALRMAGEQPDLVLGIDPTLLFVAQFLALQKYTSPLSAFVLPLTLEQLPECVDSFDLVFSLGVFYHRRSPLDHLLDLKKRLKPGGKLVLETLVIEGGEGQVLLPQDRYAQMRNVWFLPSVPTLMQWMQRCGFADVRAVDVSVTSIEEQRSTDWMKFQSLRDFLDPADPTKTVEGYPAPCRATLIGTIG